MQINPYTEDLDRIFFDVNRLLHRFGIFTWLECGTLLGYVREQNYLAWEYDIDLGADIGSLYLVKTHEFKSCADALGLKFVVQDASATFTFGGNVHLDINFYEKDEINYVMPRWKPNNRLGSILKLVHRVASAPSYYSVNYAANKKNLLIQLSKFFILLFSARFIKWVTEKLLKYLQYYSPWRVPVQYFQGGFEVRKFRNVTINIPINSNAYLEYRYGTDWGTAKRDWDTETQDATIFPL